MGAFHMVETTSHDNVGRAVNRRTLVKGAAWAMPAVTVGAAAPAMAASIPPRGLNGWVEVGKRCRWDWDWGDLTWRYPTTVDIDGRGSYPNRGIWVFIDDSRPEATPENATITFFFQRSNLSWDSSSGSGWSNLVRDPSKDSISGVPAGYYAYTTTYSGTWTYSTGASAWIADFQPRFTTTYDRDDCRTVRTYAWRSVTTNGETVTFLRGPVTL